MNNGKICIPVAAETAEKAHVDIRVAEENADIVEIRVDALDPVEIKPLLTGVRTDTPLLITYRPLEQGGRDISLEQRIEFWNEIGNLIDTSDLLFDQEADLIGRVNKQSNPVTIRSFHDFVSVPDDLDAVFDSLAVDDDIIKIAVTATDITDTISLWKLIEKARSAGKGIIPIAMGEAGKWTRILGLAHGAFLTYASLDTGKETAGGQLTAKELIEIYRAKELDENTLVYGIIGDPVAKSLSPAMLNPAFVSAGINAVYLPFQVKSLDEFLRRMVLPQTREVELNFAGFSVTMPHKESIIKYLDEIDAVAEKIGAVNTVKIENGKLSGYNTDVHGFIAPLKAKYGDLHDARVAVFGAGGAARACVYALKQEKAVVTIVARNEEKARTMADELGVAFSSLSKTKYQSPIAEFDIIVDTTPLGMAGAMADESLFTSDELTGIKFVYDLVTKNGDTPIIREAKLAGVPALGGIEMLLEQGVKQFEIWTDRAAPVDVMRDALFSKIRS